jgi:hypothetical protein
MPDRRAYIRRETAISAAINVGISMIFFLALFRQFVSVPVWGGHGLIADCLPQGFMVGLMSVLPPGFITRARIRRSKMQGCAATPRQLQFHGLVTGLGAMLCLTALAAALALISGAAHLAFWPGLLLKAAAGGIVATIATPLALRAQLK